MTDVATKKLIVYKDLSLVNSRPNHFSYHAYPALPDSDPSGGVSLQSAEETVRLARFQGYEIDIVTQEPRLHRGDFLHPVGEYAFRRLSNIGQKPTAPNGT